MVDMLFITNALKRHLIANDLADAARIDDESYVRGQTSDAISSGRLEPKRLAELASLPVNGALHDWLIANGHAKSDQPSNVYLEAAKAALLSGALSIEKARELLNNNGPPVRKVSGEPSGKKTMSTTLTGPSISDLANTAGAGTGGAGTNIRVKKASERYSSETTPVINKMTGQPLIVFGSPVNTPSEASLARIGAWFKHFLAAPANAARLRKWDMKVPELNEHEKQLLLETVHEQPWCGEINQTKHIDRATLEESGISVKAILDDATSGGQYLVPFEFDTAIVRLPYLNSQILPFVDLRTASSSEVRTGKMGQVSVSWGVAEGTPISLFGTDTLISEIQIPILACTAACEFGKDFQADTPVVDFGAQLVDEFGQAMLSEMDRVICDGNGTTEPEGFMQASGTVTVNSDNAAAGPWTLNDFIELYFGVGLQYRQLGLNGCFISNDNPTYMRTRQIRIDPQASTTDQRPVLSGVDQFGNYISLGQPHRISNTGMGNRELVYACLKKYRLYRRTGIETMLVDQDWTLARQNKRGLIIRSRVGGKLVDGNAVAKIVDGQS